MKIDGFQSDIVVLPVQELMDAVADRGGTFPCVTLRLRTDHGIEGIGVTFWGVALTKALKATVDGLAELVIGENPMASRQSWRNLTPTPAISAAAAFILSPCRHSTSPCG